MQVMVKAHLLVTVLLVARPPCINSFEPRPEIGYSSGFLPECPGMTKNATINPKTINMLKITVHGISDTGHVFRKVFPMGSAHNSIPKEKTIDLKNKKTLLLAAGFVDSSIYPQNQAIGTAYAKRGYNVLITETFHFLLYIYPKSVRLMRYIAKKIGEFLAKLTEHGLSADNLELVGASLGGHTANLAAKHFYTLTGKKPSRLTGLDPAGPCFRSLPAEQRLDSSDAERVDVIHTNIDGYGIAERLGHIDFYVNGGEYQPSPIPYLPCLISCSHVHAMIFWWQAMEHPKKFIGVQCDSVQDARLAKCFNNTLVNYMGAAANFSRPGIYYLPTSNLFPYYRGKDGLKEENDLIKSFLRNLNSEDVFEAS